MELTGRSLIGFARAGVDGVRFNAVNPATGEQLQPEFHSASAHDVNAAALLARGTFIEYGRASGRVRATLLERIADGLQASSENIVERAVAETGLPVSRLRTELARTCHQLRMFADRVSEGSWVDARIDHGDAERKPVPKPDVRSMLRPLGPVAVFGSSNFPLAFSVAGGDTASALASGCPVIVKAHPAHPGTSELVGNAIIRAVRESSLPEGVFSLLFDAGYEIGVALVKHPAVKAVGFTGSRKGGIALMDAAASRMERIPVFAEMGSVNPVFVLPGALEKSASEIAAGLHASVTLGVGQFCTNPGLVFMIHGGSSGRFLQELQRLMKETPAGVMLTQGICTAYLEGSYKFASTPGVETLVKGLAESSYGKALAGPALFATDGKTFLSQKHLMDEVFGPSTLAVTCSGREEFLSAAKHLEGQLTATIHGTEEDLTAYPDLIGILEARVGRLVFNGFPTGVEVCNAMVHGGPYPATSDSRSTSVGTRAIQRFARPVCYQNSPDLMLPDELKESNPLGIWRLVDGEWRK
jgi:alpha-ketoglutaric semialdehyde dehydrogenase